jgi:hypothetical protein
MSGATPGPCQSSMSSGRGRTAQEGECAGDRGAERAEGGSHVGVAAATEEAEQAVATGGPDLGRRPHPGLSGVFMAGHIAQGRARNGSDARSANGPATTLPIGPRWPGRPRGWSRHRYASAARSRRPGLAARTRGQDSRPAVAHQRLLGSRPIERLARDQRAAREGAAFQPALCRATGRHRALVFLDQAGSATHSCRLAYAGGRRGPAGWL